MGCVSNGDVKPWTFRHELPPRSEVLGKGHLTHASPCARGQSRQAHNEKTEQTSPCCAELSGVACLEGVCLRTDCVPRVLNSTRGSVMVAGGNSGRGQVARCEQLPSHRRGRPVLGRRVRAEDDRAITLMICSVIAPNQNAQHLCATLSDSGAGRRQRQSQPQATSSLRARESVTSPGPNPPGPVPSHTSRRQYSSNLTRSLNP